MGLGYGPGVGRLGEGWLRSKGAHKKGNAFSVRVTMKAFLHYVCQWEPSSKQLPKHVYGESRENHHIYSTNKLLPKGSHSSRAACVDWVTCFENMVYLLQIFSKQLQHTFQLVHFRSQSGRGIFTAGNKKQKTLLAGASMAGFVWHFFFFKEAPEFTKWFSMSNDSVWRHNRAFSF